MRAAFRAAFAARRKARPIAAAKLEGRLASAFDFALMEPSPAAAVCELLSSHGVLPLQLSYRDPPQTTK